MGTEVKAWLVWCMKEMDAVYKKHTQSYTHTHTDTYVFTYDVSEENDRQLNKN